MGCQKSLSKSKILRASTFTSIYFSRSLSTSDPVELPELLKLGFAYASAKSSQIELKVHSHSIKVKTVYHCYNKFTLMSGLYPLNVDTRTHQSD